MSNDGSLLASTEINKVPKYYLACLGGWAAAFCVGSTIGYSSPALPSLDSSTSHLKLDDTTKSWFGGLMPIGGLVGGLIAGKLIDLIGRRSTLLAATIPLVVGWLLIGYAVNVPMLLIGRVVTGLSAGCLSLASPVYIGEIATPKTRGFLGSGFQLSICIGVLCVYLIGAFAQWSYLACYCAYFPVIPLVIMLFMPETPTFLIKQNYVQQATEAVFFLYGNDHNLIALSLTRENMDEDEASGQPVLIESFTRARYRIPILIGVAMMFFQQFSGVTAIFFYTESIFNEAKSSIDAKLSSIFVGLVQVVFTLLGCFMMDRAGRRLLLLISSLFMAAAMGLLSLYYFLLGLKGQAFSDLFGWIPLSSLLTFVIFFSIGFGPIPWLLLSEIIPTRVKGFASALITGTNWLFMAIVTTEFNMLADAIGFRFVYLILSCVSVFAFVFCLCYVPETKGRSLAEIEHYFRRNEYTQTP